MKDDEFTPEGVRATMSCEECQRLAEVNRKLKLAIIQADAVICAMHQRIMLLGEKLLYAARLRTDLEEYCDAWNQMKLSPQASTESRTPGSDSSPQSPPAKQPQSDDEKP